MRATAFSAAVSRIVKHGDLRWEDL